MKSLLAVLLSLALFSVAGASEPVDRMVAVVEKSPIFMSDVEGSVAEELYLRRMRGEPLPSSEAEVEDLKMELLDALIDRRIVLEKARREGIEVTRPEVEDALNSWVVDLMQAAGSEQAFMDELERQGMTLRGLKDRYRKDLREQIIISKFMRMQFASAAVDESDIRQFYDAKYDSIPGIPAVAGFSRILIVPEPSGERVSAVLDKVERCLGRIEAGESFADVAREMSEDVLTRDSGGLLGTVSREDLGPEIAEAILTVEPGEISEPVRTGYGYEVIRVDDEVDGKLRLSHVFFKLQAEKADTSAAAELARYVRESAISGESFEELTREHSDDEQSREVGGYMGEVEIRALGEPRSSVLARMSPGEVSPVIATERGFEIMKLVSKSATRKPSYEESKEWIRGLLEGRMRERQFREWLDSTREELFVRRYAF